MTGVQTCALPIFRLGDSAAVAGVRAQADSHAAAPLESILPNSTWFKVIWEILEALNQFF